MKLLSLSFCMLLIQQLSISQNYAINQIPDSLKTDAFIVVRSDSKQVVLTDVNKGVAKRKTAYSILKKVGEQQAYLVVPYDNETKATINSITMYDENGIKIRKIKPDEIFDVPAYSGALFADNRIKYFKPDYAQFPYTIEYDYEVSSKNMISQGIWSPYTNYNQSIQNSLFTITFPPHIHLNKREFGLVSSETITPDGVNIWTWNSQNLKAICQEPYSSAYSEIFPSVYLMSSVIKWDTFVGNSNTWEGYGQWAFSLYDGRSELCETEKKLISELLKNTPDTLSQMKKLYAYMQDHTRYVGIQVGIGGFQPFDAKTVFETGYGDCKALTNYMYSLLKYAGIESHPALVSCGTYIEPIMMDFPNFHQFNHVILAIPYKNDTIWLESTSQTIPFGFLGDFTDDRDVLLLTKDGGEFAHTIKYIVSDNLKSTNTDIIIDSLGTATCKLSTSYKALQYDEIMDIFNLNSDEQKKWLYDGCDFPSPQITTFSISQNKTIIPNALVTHELISRNYATFTGNYMIVPINVNNRIAPIAKMLKPRKTDIVISRDYSYSDTINIEIPKGYIAESLPQSKSIESKFGKYSYTIKSSSNKIIYTRILTTLKGKHPSSDYKEFYETMLAISKMDGLKVMLTKK